MIVGTVRLQLGGHLADTQRYHSAAERQRIIAKWKEDLPVGFKDKTEILIAPDLTSDALRECLYVLEHYNVDQVPAKVAYKLGLSPELLTSKIIKWRKAGMKIAAAPRQRREGLTGKTYGYLQPRRPLNGNTLRTSDKM
jgi:hypothetical protein